MGSSSLSLVGIAWMPTSAECATRRYSKPFANGHVFLIESKRNEDKLKQSTFAVRRTRPHPEELSTWTENGFSYQMKGKKPPPVKLIEDLWCNEKLFSLFGRRCSALSTENNTRYFLPFSFALLFFPGTLLISLHLYTIFHSLFRAIISTVTVDSKQLSKPAVIIINTCQ